MTKPFALLIKDHAKVKGILDELLANERPAAADCQRLFQQLQQELQLHEEIEEQAVYPLLAKKAATKDLALESYEEHHVVDQLLAEISQLDPSEPSWQAKLTVLAENLLHHIAEEENELFPEAEENLPKAKLQSMQEQIEDLKQQNAK